MGRKPLIFSLILILLLSLAVFLGLKLLKEESYPEVEKKERFEGIGENLSKEELVVNSGIVDLTEGGSAWYDIDGKIIGRISLATDFLRIDLNLTRLDVYGYDGSRLYEMDFSKWIVGNASLERAFKAGDVRVYYFDWLKQKWRLWQRGRNNSTHGMPDFEHPAFRQAFKWMISFNQEASSLNLTFYITSHDPYIRILVNSNGEDRLISTIEPMKLKKIGVEAPLSDYRKHLLDWNQRNSKFSGNPWSLAVWSDTAQGLVGQMFIMKPSSGVEIRKITKYYDNLNRFVQGHAYDFFNWEKNSTENWYSYEFYIKNEREVEQDVLLENFVPNAIERVEVSVYDGNNYIPVGVWSNRNFGKPVYFTDVLGYKHYMIVHEPIYFGGKTRSGVETSSYRGVLNRVLMEFNLAKGYVNDPSVYGGSQLRLRLKFYYKEPGYATFLFSTDNHPKYGLGNMLSPYVLLYNYSKEDHPLFVSADLTKAEFFVTSDENEVIRELGFYISLSPNDDFIFSLGYTGQVDAWRDDNRNEIPDIFETSAFEWSSENLSKVSRASLVYYDIRKWTVEKAREDIVRNEVELTWHGSYSSPRYFGLGIPCITEKEEYSVSVVRNLKGKLHLLSEAGNHIAFATSYDVREFYYQHFDFDYTTSVFNISISYQTQSGLPYNSYTVVEIRDMLRKIYRADEIPEGKRNMPDLKYWKVRILRDGLPDTSNWDVSYYEDLFKRFDTFSSINYSIMITIDPSVEVKIDYSKKIGENNLQIAFDYGYMWETYFDSRMAVKKAKDAGFKMARIHLRTLYKGVRWPPSPSLGWDPEAHSSKGYDWSMLDYWILRVVNDWQMIPMMSIGGSKKIAIPKNMPYIKIGKGKILPAKTDFARYFADVVKHIVVDLNISPVYLEVMNEPTITNDTVALMYVDLYNEVRRKVEEELKPYNKTIGRDVYLGINYIDRWQQLRKPFFYHVYQHAEDLEFASVHDYPGGWGHCFSSWVKNLDYKFYPPNNKHGWMTDEFAVKNAYNYTALHGIDPRVTFREMKERWKGKFGHDLILMNTEANFNSAWEFGSDPRQQNLISAVVHAIMLKNFALNNFSIYTFFQLASMHTPESPMYKYGGFGLCIMESSPPHKPFAPYWVAYLWGNYMKKGSDILAYEISDPDLIDILPVKTEDGYRVWVINKVDSAVTIRVNKPDFHFSRITMYILDRKSYNQTYDPALDRVVFGNRSIRIVSLNTDEPIEMKLEGYTVGILEMRI